MGASYLWGWDATPGAEQWRKILVNNEGKLIIDPSEISLNDLGDVNAPAPADNDALTWDAATGLWISKAAGGATLTIAETEVFNGTSPTVWTDLDLSGTIGAQATLVLIKLFIPAYVEVVFRKNGDTDERYVDPPEAKYTGVSGGDLARNIHQDFLVATDAAGKIEWKTEAATAGTTIDIIAYIK